MPRPVVRSGQAGPPTQAVEGLEFYFKGEFVSAAPGPVDPDAWGVQKSAGAVAPDPVVNGSLLTIATGTQNGDVVEAFSKELFQPPFRAVVVLDSISQRIGGQELSIELVEVDPRTGAPVLDGGGNRTGIFYSSATANVAKFQSWSDGDTPGATGFQTVQITSAPQLVEIKVTADDVWFYTSPVDSTNARATTYRINRRVPNPNALYCLRLRAKNTAAGVTNTNFVIDNVMVENFTAIVAEIENGRGAQSAAESIPVGVNSLPPAPASGNRIGQVGADARWWSEAVAAAIAAAGSANGASRDAFGIASGAVANGATVGSKEFRAGAASDQAFTLGIEMSADSTTWDRIAEVASAVRGGKNTAVLSVPTVARYFRTVITNTGAVATTFNRVNSAVVAV